MATWVARHARSNASRAYGAASQPRVEIAASSSSGSDMCSAVALFRVSAIGNPDNALAPGDIDSSITQYVVSNRTGEASFCSHGGSCNPRYISKNGRMTEALHLENCRIGAKSFVDAEDTTYNVDLDRSKNSPAALKYSDVTNALSNMGLCSACAGNATQYYIQEPDSECGVLVKRALQGDVDSRAHLTAVFPAYCQWHGQWFRDVR